MLTSISKLADNVSAKMKGMVNRKKTTHTSLRGACPLPRSPAHSRSPAPPPLAVDVNNKPSIRRLRLVVMAAGLATGKRSAQHFPRCVASVP